MKLIQQALFTVAICTVALCLPQSLQAIPTTATSCIMDEKIPPCGDEAMPLIDVRVCFNALVFSVCVTLECKFHWTDALVPSVGQVFDGYGCKVKGQIANDGGGILTTFEGTSEDMITALERTIKTSNGTITQLTVHSAEPFLAPDGKPYVVIAKTYPVLNGKEGRYLPLEIMPAKQLK